MSKEGYWRDLHCVPTNYHTIKDILLAIRTAVEHSKRGVVQFIYRALGGLGVGGAVDINHLRINCTAGNLLALPIELAKVLSYDIAKLRKFSQALGISIQKLSGGTREWCVISTATDYAGRQFMPSPLSEKITIKIIDAERDIGLFQNMYINTDLIQTQYVGETRATVLRIIAPVQEKGEVETFNFAPIFYLPLRIVKFNTIEINITGDTGKLVPFDGGVVVIVLHLRRKHNILI